MFSEIISFLRKQDRALFLVSRDRGIQALFNAIIALRVYVEGIRLLSLQTWASKGNFEKNGVIVL